MANGLLLHSALIYRSDVVDFVWNPRLHSSLLTQAMALLIEWSRGASDYKGSLVTRDAQPNC
jgi:hypothetical protein